MDSVIGCYWTAASLALESGTQEFIYLGLRLHAVHKYYQHYKPYRDVYIKPVLLRVRRLHTKDFIQVGSIYVYSIIVKSGGVYISEVSTASITWRWGRTYFAV